jgi:hypothetical protein
MSAANHWTDILRRQWDIPVPWLPYMFIIRC